MKSRIARIIVAACAALALVVGGASFVSAEGACLASATSDTGVPSNPAFGVLPSAALAAAASLVAPAPGAFVRLGCSEKVTVYTQTTPYTGPNSAINSSLLALPNLSSWPRVSCPHLDPALTPFEDDFPSGTVAAGTEVRVLAGSNLLLRACSLPSASQTDPAFIFTRLVVSTGATLVIDDAPLTLRVREIVVEAGGKLLAGSATCRLFSKIQIVFHGSAATSALSTPLTRAGEPTKGLLNYGIVDFHGKLFFPTWTRLARSAGGVTSASEDSSIVFLQEGVNWEVGQSVLVTTSILYDCTPSEENAWCKPCYGTCATTKQQNEVRTIVALGHAPNLPSTSTSIFTALKFDSPLQYVHYGGFEYQSEVALLSRRVEFLSEDSGDRFGGHIQTMGPAASARFSGVRGDGMGQLNQLGRYPFHWHMMFESEGARASYLQDSAITNSNFRCGVIHGTNNTRLSRNVAFNVTGMCYYLEDGVEEKNLLEYNLAAYIHPILRPANGGFGQEGETFLAQPGLLIPADTSAAGFYALNAMNSFIGNAVSGGWTGFAFPNCPRPMGDFKNTLPADSLWNPYKRPLLRFIGNTAHSSGYHWVEHGSCMYVGAWLDYNSAGVMQYNSGRHSRDTVVTPSGASAIMLMEHSKVWMCNKGIAHWGNTATIQHTEIHDIRVSAMMFGESALVNALVTGKTPNLKLNSGGSNFAIGRSKTGFQTYDTWVKTILSGVTFRNYSSVYSESAFRYMDHSDHYTPQGINSVRGIKFEGVDALARIAIDHCGADCGGTSSTMSSRIYSVWDWDGSLSGRNVPTIIGSHESWWNNSPEQDCVFQTNTKVWVCDWLAKATIGFIGPGVAGMSGGCDANVATGCSDQYAPYTVGRMSQWGSGPDSGLARSVLMPPWNGVAGFANTGWYWRPKAPVYGVDGAPSTFTINSDMQLARGNFIVLAVAYPPNTNFNVTLESVWWKDNGVVPSWVVPQAANLSRVTQTYENLNPTSSFVCTGQWYDMCKNTGVNTGPVWFFDGTHLYIRVVSPACYNSNRKGACDPGLYVAGGISVPRIQEGFLYRIRASCPGCAVQSNFSGTTYWTTTDAPPSTRFATDFGAIRTPPATPAVELTKFAQCAATAASSSTAGAFMASSTAAAVPTRSSSSTAAAAALATRSSSSSTAAAFTPVASSTVTTNKPSSSSTASAARSSTAAAAPVTPSSTASAVVTPSSTAAAAAARSSSTAAASVAKASSSSTAGASIPLVSSTAAVKPSSSSTAASAARSSTAAAAASTSSSTAASVARSSSSAAASARSSSSGVAAAVATSSTAGKKSSSTGAAPIAPASSTAGKKSSSSTGVATAAAEEGGQQATAQLDSAATGRLSSGNFVGAAFLCSVTLLVLRMQ